MSRVAILVFLFSGWLMALAGNGVTAGTDIGIALVLALLELIDEMRA